MSNKNYLLDFEWLVQQKQWNAYQNFLQDKIDEYVSIFIKDTTRTGEELKELQIRISTLNSIKNSVQKYIDEIKENMQ